MPGLDWINMSDARKVLVSVHGYAGDAHQVAQLAPYFRHHGYPVLVVSPEDSPITKEALKGRGDDFEYAFSGLREYIGNTSMERQHLHMSHLLSLGYDWYLMNDADSFCLASKLPGYLFEQDVLWSNEVSDTCHKRPAGWPYPRLAFQPPYFCSRNILEQLVAARAFLDFDREDFDLKFIDHYMMRLADAADIPHAPFRVVSSFPTRNYPPGIRAMCETIKKGAVMLHAIKSQDVINTAWATYNKKCATRAKRDGKTAEKMRVWWNPRRADITWAAPEVSNPNMRLKT
jgi:hypothetical protein